MAEINHYFSDKEAFQLDTVSVRLVKTREPLTSEVPLTSSDAVVAALAKEMSDYDREVIGVINFDSKMRPVNVNFVSAGALNYSVAHPRELMKSAILSNASSMMMIHNHPSQDTTPSKADVEITDRMMQICELMGIPLVDHIIVGGYGKEYFSFADKGVMPVTNMHYEKNYMNLNLSHVAEKNDYTDEYAAVMEKQTSYKASDRQDKIKEITERLEEGVKEIFESDNYKNYLKTMSKFHAYSFNNTLLIAQQKPDATLVAGFKSWENNFGRHVKKGEKGIRILAPSPYKKKIMVEKVDPVTKEIITDKNGNPVKEETEVKMTAYRIVSVFDLSQTEGMELPNIGVIELSDNVQEYEIFMEALKQSTSIPIEFEDIPNKSAKGYFDNVEQRIVIREAMSESQSVKTAVHELAHSILHNMNTNPDGAKKDRLTKEVEAESVAYTVCQHFGIDTSNYSFGYIAGWSSGKDVNELKQSLETIQKTATELITNIEDRIPKIRKEKQLEENVPESVTKDDEIHLNEDDEQLEKYQTSIAI